MGLCRDFNEILHELEKLGGLLQSFAKMEGFCEAMDSWEFIDIGFGVTSLFGGINKWKSIVLMST